MLKILQARLQQYMNRELPDVQAGFRKGRGTRDQIDNICWITEKAREFQKNIYFCFTDYAKAFDCVDHNKLWKILKEMRIPDHLSCLLRNLYAGQEATVRTRHRTTDWFQIGKRVRQGCILSPCLFNLYAEYIMWNARLEEAQAGIKTAGRNINNLRYADTTLMAEGEELKSMDREAWHAAVRGIIKSRTWLSDWTEPVLGAPSSARGRLCPPPASFCCAAPRPHPLAQPNSYHMDVSPSWPMGNQASLWLKLTQPMSPGRPQATSLSHLSIKTLLGTCSQVRAVEPSPQAIWVPEIWRKK